MLKFDAFQELVERHLPQIDIKAISAEGILNQLVVQRNFVFTRATLCINS